MSGEGRRRQHAVHVHVHSGAAPAAVDVVQEQLEQLRAEVRAFGAELSLLARRDDVLAESLNVIAHKLHDALGGDHRRKLRRGQPSVAMRLNEPGPLLR